MNVIAKIEKLRNERNWSKYKLAEESMLTYSTLSAIYARETPPKLEILEMICNAFGITLAQFFSEGEPTETVTEEERHLLEKFRALSSAKKQAVLTIISKD